jgi:hypothetical protein
MIDDNSLFYSTSLKVRICGKSKHLCVPPVLKEQALYSKNKQFANQPFPGSVSYSNIE